MAVKQMLLLLLSPERILFWLSTLL